MSAFDAMRARLGSLPQSKIEALPLAVQRLLVVDMPTLIEAAKAADDFLNFVKSDDHETRGPYYLDNLEMRLRVIRDLYPQRPGLKLVETVET